MCATSPHPNTINKTNIIPDIISVNSRDEDLALLVHKEDGTDHGGLEFQRKGQNKKRGIPAGYLLHRQITTVTCSNLNFFHRARFTATCLFRPRTQICRLLGLALLFFFLLHFITFYCHFYCDLLTFSFWPIICIGLIKFKKIILCSYQEINNSYNEFYFELGVYIFLKIW